MAKYHFDVAIIGGGIVGCATAYWICKRFKAKVILLEREQELATHQSGRNSGVIHSGVYYRPGSQKANFCASGRKQLYHFCREHGIAFDRCGKIIVANNTVEEKRLEQLLKFGTENGLEELEILDKHGIQLIEPASGGIAALHVPDAGIVDYSAVTKKLADLAAKNGCTIETNAGLVDCEADSRQGLILATRSGFVQSRCLINCAGLHSDRVAKICDVDTDVRIIPFRGEYFTVAGTQCDLVNGLIYPVPDPELPFLGVHMTKKLDQSVEIGPNALFASGRHAYYGFRLNNVPDLISSLSFPGFWRLTSRHWKTGIGEIYRSVNKSALLKDIQKLVPALKRSDIHRSHSGIRAQAVSRQGELLNDFLIERGRNSIHVLNAPSPAATASLAIGQYIADIAQDHLDLITR